MAAVVLMVAGVAGGYRAGTPHTVVQRIDMWLSPWNNDVHGGDQLAHALWAFATGGATGSGPDGATPE
jgi:cell division protein FtsW (lipid II flippase)